MIENLKKYRADGRVVSHDITVEEYLRLAWPPSVIVKIQWTVGSELFACERYERISYALSSSRNYLALLTDPNAAYEAKSIDLLDQFGSSVGVVPTPSTFMGHPLEGSYIGVSQDVGEDADSFVARFQSTQADIYNVYIETRSSCISRVSESR